MSINLTKTGLRFHPKAMLAGTPLAKPSTKFVPPPIVGNWEYMTPSENQYNHPWCAAFAMCAILQAAYWRQFGYPVQFDEAALYAAAKKIDGNDEDGTYLESVIAASKRESFCVRRCAPPKIEEALFTNPTDIKWVLHQYGLALLGLTIDEGWQYPREPDWLITPQGNILGGHAIVGTWYDTRPELDAPRVGGSNWWGKGGERWSMTFSGFGQQFDSGYGLHIDFQQEAT